MAESKGLAESILLITNAIPSIPMTGKSPFSQDPALSIGDVEGAVRPLLVSEGVLIRCRTRNLVPPHDGVREWVVELTFHVESTSDQDDTFEEEWADCGSTPGAAFSFARKSYLKALFHIADAEEAATKPAANGHQTPPVARNDSAAPSVPDDRPKALPGVCEQCEMAGYKSKKGYAPRYYQSARGDFQCNGLDPEGIWQNHRAKS